MKILLLNFEYPPVGGGGGVATKNYAEEWARKGHQVEVITSNFSGLPAQDTKNGVKVIRLEVPQRSYRATASFRAMLGYIVSGGRLVWRKRKYYRQFDIINTHFALPTGPLGVLAKIILKVPNVLTIIGGDIYDPSLKRSPHRNFFYQRVNRYIINAADSVIAISNDIKNRAREYYKITRPIKAVNIGFRLVGRAKRDRQRLKLDESKFYLIAVGRLVGRKGFPYAITALKYLPEMISLLIIGDGPEMNDLMEIAKHEGVSQRVIFLGYHVSDINRYLACADIFILSSLHEGMGIVIQEAMAAGLPVISTNIGGQTDLIKDQINGLLVSPGSSREIALAVKALAENPALREKMSANNLRDIKKYDLTDNAEVYVQIFRSLIA